MGNHNNYPNPRENPYRVQAQPKEKSVPINQQTTRIDFNSNRICPSCGKIISLKHNFCKFCGVDLSGLRPMQDADRTMRELAKTALTDPNADVRKDAVDTLGDFGEYEVLGVLAYILLNDPDENVRKEAADELGDLHHIISLDVLAKALKDRSPIVRKEAIEGLKKIKKKNKPEKREDNEKVKVEKQEEVKEKEESETLIAQEEKSVSVDEEQKEQEFKEVEDEDESEPLEEIEREDDDYYKI
ncbi:MAG: hypothetical protein EU531_10635 [Promethearchaeota archaeon]|nr:MAG: hypothetical protein EU531_10635 [Candidatus Lokiarchaeota archaeon]